MKPYAFRLWHLIAVLFVCELGFGVIYFAGANIGEPKVDHFFDLDQEANLPAWFSSMQLFCVAALFALRGPGAFASLRLPVVVPLIAAAAFLFLSMDEIAQVHERIGRELKGTAAPQVRGGRAAWVFVYLAAALPFVLLAVRYLPPLWGAYPRLVIYGFLGSACYAAGAVGVELFADQFLRGYADIRHLYLASVLTEELLEMMGGTLILFGAAQLTLPRSQATWSWKPSPAAVPGFRRLV